MVCIDGVDPVRIVCGAGQRDVRAIQCGDHDHGLRPNLFPGIHHTLWERTRFARPVAIHFPDQRIGPVDDDSDPGHRMEP